MFVFRETKSVYISSSDITSLPVCPHPLLYNGRTTRIGSDHLYITGGDYPNRKLMMIYHIPAQTWQPGTELETDREYHIAVAMTGTSNPNRLLIAGGMSQSSATMFDTVTHKFSPLPPLPHPRSNACAVNFRGKVYLFGGREETPMKSGPILATCMVYDEDSKTGEGKWQPIAPMPTKRMTASAVIVNDKILVLGGEVATLFSKRKNSDSIVEYSPATNKWRKLLWTLPKPMFSFGAVYHPDLNGGTLLIAGGSYDTDTAVYSRVQSLTTNKWVTCGTFNDYVTNYCA